MEKRSISLKSILLDMKNGLGEDVIKEKYQISDQQLLKVLGRAIEKGAITEADIAYWRSGGGLRIRGSKKHAPATDSENSLPSGLFAHESPSTSSRSASDTTLPAVAAPDKGPTPRMEPAAKTSRKFRMPWIRIALVVFLIGVAAMVKYTSWYVWVPVLVVGVMSLGWLIPYLIKRAFLSGFKAKGKVLADANVTVHATKPTKPPAVDPAEQTENAEDSTANYRWFILDVTITPQEQKGPFGLWEPGELQVVGPDVTRKQMNKDLDIETAGDIAEIRILDPELKKFVRDEGGKYPGSQRLRCRVGVKPDVYQVQLRYYFELFGRIDFP